MIDTKKAREMRARGTAGEWEQVGEHVYGANSVDVCFTDCGSDDAALIAYAVNNIVPFADEIERLRLAVQTNDHNWDRAFAQREELRKELESTKRELNHQIYLGDKRAAEYAQEWENSAKFAEDDKRRIASLESQLARAHEAAEKVASDE